MTNPRIVHGATALLNKKVANIRAALNPWAFSVLSYHLFKVLRFTKMGESFEVTPGSPQGVDVWPGPVSFVPPIVFVASVGNSGLMAALDVEIPVLEGRRGTRCIGEVTRKL